MTSIASLSTLVGSVKAAIEIAKLLKNSYSSLEKAETKLKLAELVSLLAEAKSELSEVQQLLVKKDDEIQKLKDQLSLKENIEWDSPYYWVYEGEKRTGPYCQKCYDSEQVLIHLQGNGEGYWDCRRCKNGYKDKNYKSTIGIVSTRHRLGGF